MLDEPLAVTLEVIAVLDALAVPYVIGGSLASATHGTARATMDADLVVALDDGAVPELVARLQSRFYIDEGAAYRAVAAHSSFNLIHYDTMFKLDLFVAKERPFDVAQLAQRQAVVVDESSGKTVYVLSPENTILAKLEWYRLGGDQSERQWRDVLGIVNVQTELDWAYLVTSAREMGIADLIERIISMR